MSSQETSRVGNSTSSDSRRTNANPQPSTSRGAQRGGDLFLRTENGENPIDFYLDVRRTRSFRGSNWAQERTYRVEASRAQRGRNEQVRNVLPQMNNMFEALLQDVNQRQSPQDFGRVYINHPNLQRAIIVRPAPLEHLSAKKIMDKIAHVLQSEENIPLDENLDINIATVKRVGGRGFAKQAYILDYEKDRITKKSVLTVPVEPEDFLCLAKAVVIANAYSEAKYAEEGERKQTLKRRAETLRRSHGRNRLRQEVNILMNSCNIPSSRQGYLDDIPHYENFLKKSICVISSAEGNDIIYPGSDRYRTTSDRLYLYHWKPYLSDSFHFDVVTNVAAFMGKADICLDCDKILSHGEKENHSCFLWCTVCQSKQCLLQRGAEIQCANCNFTCRSQACYLRHQKPNKNGVNLCSSKYKCKLCHVSKKDAVRPREHHVCGETFCNNCKTWHINSKEGGGLHLCYMRAQSKRDTSSSERFIFYDFESNQESGTHIPNLVVAQTACSRCKSVKDVQNAFCNFCGNRCSKCHEWNFKEKCFEKLPCQNNKCGKREIIFRENDVTHVFGSWVLEKQHRGCTFVAHNAKAYDNYFLLNYFLQKSITPSVIFNGSKAVYMRIGKGPNIRFLDSCMFLPMALSELPKCFDLAELKKGYFPHFFNKAENYGKIFNGLPPIETYGFASMSKDKQEQFLKWYEQNQLLSFNFEQEMLQYCQSDVDILRRACLYYRQLLMEVTCKDESRVEETGIDPFSFVSAASVCMGVFQARFLPEIWKVLPKTNAFPNCSHDSERCKCPWLTSKKKDGDSPIELTGSTRRKLTSRELLQMEKQFVSSPIGLQSAAEYRPKQNYSLEAIEWLNDCEIEINKLFESLGEAPIKIQNAYSAEGEKCVKVSEFQGLPPSKLRLDGYYYDTLVGNHVALEFYGCHWHGCPKCFKDSERRIKTQCHSKSMEQRYEETMLREERLRREGYVIRSIWACEFANKLLRETAFSPQLLRKVKDVHISLRECYFGGRTAATKMYHDFRKSASVGVVGKYVDFTSLYPWALKYGVFPIGHPKRFTLNQVNKEFPNGVVVWKDCQIPPGSFQSYVRYCPLKIKHKHVHLRFFGIAKIFVIPPATLLHPVLPYRCKDGKLVFPLCASCSEQNRQQGVCICEDKQRGWVGTFCSGEIEAALEMGYQIKKIFEILHWDISSNALFEEYVNCFLQIKQEASGYPQKVQTEEEIEEYIKLYKSKENIVLRRDKIKKSSALRSLAKLMLNSLYGKFGQRPMLRKTHIVNSVSQLCTLMSSPVDTVVDFHVLSDDIMHVESEANQHFAGTNNKTNVVISAFTTSWARLKLWALMHRLGSRLLYTDTDSMIYISEPSQEDLPLGDFLGDLADELCCKKIGCVNPNPNCSHYIVEFVSGGPKNYAYVLNSGETICKIRGFTLDSKTSLHLNFSVLKSQVFDWLRDQRKERCFAEADDYDDEEGEKGAANDLSKQLVTFPPVGFKEVVVTRTQIKRDKNTYQIFNVPTSKRYNVVFDKNVVNLKDLSSVPFGFRS